MTNNNTVQFADFDAIHEGDHVSLVRKITREDVETFAQLTGDINPLHLDDGFGARTQFGGAVAHGMLSASLISTVIGTMLPGPGALWMSQTLDFLAAVRNGDTVTVVTTVIRKYDARRVLDLHTVISNQWGTKVIEGKSKVTLLKERETDIMTTTGTVAIVTGASRGIGAACARALAAMGLKVVVNYSASEAQAHEVVSGIIESGGCAAAIQADVSDETQTAALFRQTEATFGAVDILVNNAWARLVPRSLSELSWGDFERQMTVGVKSAFLCSQAALPNMIAGKFGRIINIGSIAADNVPPVNQAAYVTAKAALAALTRSFAVELGPKGINVNLVAPGMTETGFISEVPQKARLITEVQSPLRRIAQPDDVADVVAFLASPAARYITGDTLRVCGGQQML